MHQDERNDNSSAFSGPTRTCLDIVEVVMDDGEVITSRGITLNSSTLNRDDFDENSCDLKMACERQNRLVTDVGYEKFDQVGSGSIPGGRPRTSALPGNDLKRTVHPAERSENGRKRVAVFGKPAGFEFRSDGRCRGDGPKCRKIDVVIGEKIVLEDDDLKSSQNGQKNQKTDVDIRENAVEWSSVKNCQNLIGNEEIGGGNPPVSSKLSQNGTKVRTTEYGAVILRVPRIGQSRQTDVEDLNGNSAVASNKFKNGRTGKNDGGTVEFRGINSVLSSKLPKKAQNDIRSGNPSVDMAAENGQIRKTDRGTGEFGGGHVVYSKGQNVKNVVDGAGENSVAASNLPGKGKTGCGTGGFIGGYSVVSTKVSKMVPNDAVVAVNLCKNGQNDGGREGGNSTVVLNVTGNGRNDGEFGGGNSKPPENVRNDSGVSKVRDPLASSSADPPAKKSPSKWGEARERDVKEELFRGLGLVPRGVLHDNGRPVDRRHCVTGRRTVQDSEVAAPIADDRPRNVFYPSGVPTMFDTEKFIGEIRKRPAIYDVRSKVYSNRVAKLKYWHEVGKEMYKGWEDLDQMERRSLVKELQIKWKSIRDHFMRQLKQNINGEGPRKKKYVHFDQLQFLTANLGVKRRWQPWKRNWDGEDAENSMSGSGCSRIKEENDPLQVYTEPRHSYKLPKAEPEEEYMEFTPDLPEERHFSFVSVERPDYDEREVPVAMLPTPQPEDLSYHKEPPYYQDLYYHKELEGDRMGNKMFLLSLLPILERLPDHANIRARLQLMEVLQAFVAHEEAPRDYYNYANHHNNGKRDPCDASQQHSTTSHSDTDS